MVLAAAPLVVAAGCGAGSPPTNSAAVASGQLPPSAVLVGGTHGKAGVGVATGVTVPLAKQSPTTAFFTAIGVFQSCLKELGVTFQGAPNPWVTRPVSDTRVDRCHRLP